MADPQPLPSLFDGKGAFVPLSDEAQDALSDAHRVVYQKVKRCAENLKVADANVAAAIESVRACADGVTEMENYIRKNFPPVTFHQLWRENFART